MSDNKASITKKAILRATASVLLPAVVAAALFCFTFFRDNKYRTALPGGSGYNIWDSRAARTGYGFLVDGWEYYPGRLLLPGQFQEDQTPAITYIGEHSNFSADLGTPWGCATYRITLRSGEPSGMLALYLPELPSAAEVYINGSLAGASGSLAPYSPLVRDGIYPFMPDGETEIVIRAANYSHYYGGLYYPPAVGDAGAVFRLQGTRMLVYGFFCFSALALGIFHIGLWIPGIGRKTARERRTELLFGILCLSFAAGKAHPFLLLFGFSRVRLFLAFQDFLGAVVIFCATALTLLLAGRTRAKATRAVLALEASMAAVCAVFPLFILPYAPALINGYGTLVSWWKLLTAGCIFAVSLRALAAGREPGGFLLAASTLYGSCLLAEVLTINRLEPVCGMWMEEYGCFFMAAAFGLLMAKRSVKTARENEYLYDNLQQEVEHKTEALTELLGQRRRFLAEVVHDLKTPLTAIKNYAVLIEEGDAQPDEETRAYLKAIMERMEVFDGRLSLLRDYSAGERTALKKEAVELGAFLTEFYNRNLPDIESAGHTFILKLPENGSITVRADRQALWRVLENLCYNSLSFMETGGLISLTLFREGRRAVVVAADSGSGIPEENLPHIFERDFTCREDASGEGLGLYIARSLILEHGGQISAQSEKSGGTVFTITLPAIRVGPDCE